jgi:anaerobic ribonucleoside-triphosphate reductase
MGCRSFLTPDRSGNGYDNVDKAKNYEPGKPKYYGRFNQGVVTVNLSDVALSADGDMDKFWKIFDERLELCHRALQVPPRASLEGTLSDAAPILWQYGALPASTERREDRQAPARRLLHALAGLRGPLGVREVHDRQELTPTRGRAVRALKSCRHMNDKCAKWKEAEGIDYSLYGTPLESTTYKFAKCLQKRFGIVRA